MKHRLSLRIGENRRRVLKQVAEENVPSLRIIFRKSLQCGMLPSQWKLGQVTPIFKKGDCSTPGNYRPVSSTAVLCKVMETIVRSHVMDHMVKHQLFCDEQHGFVPGRSLLIFVKPLQSSCSCVEVNHKHRDCPPSVTAQNTEYISGFVNYAVMSRRLQEFEFLKRH